MEMFVKKLVFLMVFTLLLFLMARMLEFIAWYETGLLMMKLVDPVSLSVRKLKGLLDGRGLSYEGVVDKAELTHLVKASGDVVEGEVMMMEKEVNADDEEETTRFSSKTRFDEEVEDKKDSVWLVQVLPRNHGPLLGRSAWSTVVKKLSRFGIRHGTFDCSIDPRICLQKNWNLPLLLLAMPQGNRHKDHVTLATFSSAGKAHQIIKWVKTQLAIKVKTEGRGVNEDFLDQLQLDKGGAAVKLVLVSQSQEPPMFYSALNLKYSGRVKFVFMGVQGDSQSWPSKINSQQEYPNYYVITPEGRRIYGRKFGEYFTYDAMDIYLQTLTPEANDIFILSFTTVNAICFIGLFVIQGGIAKRICTFFWTIAKYNITFILLWLPLLGIIQLPCMSPVLDYIYHVIRISSDTWLLGKLRHDWLMYSEHTYIMGGALLLYCVAINWISKKSHSLSSEENMTSAMWLRSSLVDYYSFLIRPSPAFRNGPPRTEHLEEGLDLLIEQMAVPDLWLHPTFPTNYIQDLQTWRYRCDWLRNRSSSFENDSSDSERGYSLCKDHKKRCPKLHQYVLNTRLDCRCKVAFGPAAENIKRNDFLKADDDDNDNFFVVSSKDEKPVCCQPKPTGSWDSDKGKSPFSKTPLTRQRSCERSEAQLQKEDSLLDKQEIPVRDTQINDKDIHACCRCTGKQGKYGDPNASQNIRKAESLGDYQKSVSLESPGPNRDETHQNCSTLTKKSSPKHHKKVLKPKTSPRKQSSNPNSDPWPESILFNAQCSICLDSYTHGVSICGLPCGHAYHHECIVAWLTNGNHVCPICRWPAYKKKGCKLSKHME